MLTRRQMIAGAATTGVLGRSRPSFAQASQPSTAVNFEVPPHTCDCHTHIFGDPAKYPFWSGRAYTPQPALPAEMSALHRTLNIERVVIVTPSVYGTDNSSSLYGMEARGATARGVAVIDEKTPESELDAMHQQGVRGIRLNMADAGQTDPAIGQRRLQGAIERMKSRDNWHIQMYTNLAVISSIKDLVQKSPVPLVFDHFGGARGALGPDQAGFSDLVALVRSGQAYVKVTGAYRMTGRPGDYSDMIPLAKALISANADRIVWGTDWPHPNAVTPPDRKPTDVTPLLQPDDGLLLNQLAIWAPDPAVRQKILVDNPARLYGY